MTFLNGARDTAADGEDGDVGVVRVERAKGRVVSAAATEGEERRFGQVVRTYWGRCRWCQLRHLD